MDDTTSDAMLPSNLSFESAWTRRRIIASYWAMVLLALPLWWKTTSIDRLSLPSSRIKELEAKTLRFPIHVDVGSDYLQAQLPSSLQQVGANAGLDVHFSHSTESILGAGRYKISLEPENNRGTVRGRGLLVGERGTASPETLRQTVTRLIVPYDHQTSLEKYRIVTYAPRYRLAFTLLNEDASSGHAALSWELEDAVHEFLNTTLGRFTDLHNFTIESQVQYHAPLAFKPRTVQVEDKVAHGLTQGDLTVFVNSAEWTLSSSVSNDPVLHFILFVPSSDNSPLHILDNNGEPTASHAFILPQWGGIVLLNTPTPHLTASRLRAPFMVFQRQLLSLLGVPSLPPDVEYDGPEPFSDWQLDALVRQRAKENMEDAKDTLRSIVGLVNQIENMPVGEDVRGDVQDALSELDNALVSVSNSSTTALRHTATALTLASRAFFNPGMLALLYFPAEHKYAVYAPLFASIAAPLFAAVLREVLAWRKARNAARAAAGQVKREDETQPRGERLKVE